MLQISALEVALREIHVPMSIADEMFPKVLAFMDEEMGGTGGDTSFGDEEEDEEEEDEEEEEEGGGS